ncbi:MAG: hypothetical protein O7E52_10795 [Candidatus Poribacteria bacterium]|nr:hypothetical protein [Candidatus Poribacteria bacterium]
MSASFGQEVKYAEALYLVFLIFATIFGFVAWGHKAEKQAEDGGLTLAFLGVTEEQKGEIKALWELKRQKQVQALEDLRILNRLAREKVASEGDIRGVLEKWREKRAAQEQRIKVAGTKKWRIPGSNW